MAPLTNLTIASYFAGELTDTSQNPRSFSSILQARMLRTAIVDTKNNKFVECNAKSMTRFKMAPFSGNHSLVFLSMLLEKTKEIILKKKRQFEADH